MNIKLVFVGYCVSLYLFSISGIGSMPIVESQETLSANGSQSSDIGLSSLISDNPILTTNISSSIITPWNTGNDVKDKVLPFIK